jgi:glycoside/pentoside/hexuronide:cation symporter, GPH family
VSVTAPADLVPLPTKLFYGFGAVAYGIKDNGFSVFLLLFYNQVVGLSAGLVGLTLLVALLLDAVIDPMVGHLSDRTRGRWGRRHPWLYLSAIPIAVSWYFLWLPPAASQAIQLLYLLVMATLVRMSISLNEVPSIALAPEMTHDYHERTSVLGWRYFFGWAGGLLILASAYGIFRLNEAENMTLGAYRNYAITGAIVMFVAVLVSAIGTHRRYARPTAADAHQPSLRDMAACLRFKPFRLLLLAAFFAFANQGVTFALSNYMLAYVWKFGAAQQVIYAFSLFVGVIAALVIARQAGLRYGKPGAAIRLAIAATLIGMAPYLLYILGLFPQLSPMGTLACYLPFVLTATAFSIAVMITGASMMADVTTASFRETGKQQEGVFYAGHFFTQKCVTGVGIFLSGQILALIGFPERADPATIDPAIVTNLAIAYASITLVLGLLTAWAFSRFPRALSPAPAALVPGAA